MVVSAPALVVSAPEAETGELLEPRSPLPSGQNSEGSSLFLKGITKNKHTNKKFRLRGLFILQLKNLLLALKLQRKI